MGLASINIKFTADLTGFSTEMQNSIRRIGVLGKELQNTGKNLSTFLSLPLLAAGGAAVKFASDYEESLNKVNIAFGSSAESVQEFAKTSLENFGIAEGTALDMAATFGDMATALGLPVDKAGAMSKSLVGLAGDLASFKNISIDIANTALSGIFTGETESLKKLGIVMTEANLQAFALSQGISKQVKDMTQAEKVGLRYNYILSVTTNAQGDFARTGGGAANQMRIFQESLKQIGQQLGAVILPAFTKLITFVNGAIKQFSGLSDGAKVTIVAVAGIAAAIGPVMTGMGALLTIVPNTITKFNSLKTALQGLYVVLAANPFTALFVALTALTAALVIADSRFTELTSSKKEMASVATRTNEILAKETSELNKNLAIARDKNLSDDKRKKAIDNLNDSYPEFQNNLRLETINSDATKKAVDAVTEAYIRKAKAQAAQEKLVEVQKKLLDLQQGQLEAVKPSVWQTLGSVVKSYGNAALYASAQGSALAGNLVQEQKELTSLEKSLTAIINKNTDYSDSNTEASNSLKGLIANQEKQIKAGTITFYENQIKALQELQKNVATTEVAWKGYEAQIDAIQKKIDAIEGKGPINLPKPELPTLGADESPESPVFSLQDLKAQKSYFEQLREQFSSTSEDFTAFSENVNNTQLKIDAIEGVDEVNNQIDSFGERIAAFREEIRGAIESSVESFAAGIGEALASAFNGGNLLQGLGVVIFSALGDMLVQLGKIAISTGVAVEAIKKSLLTLSGIGAIAIGVGLVALGSIVKSQVAGAGAFKDGGIVGGNSFYGDKILARVNSGELILNNSQQRAVYGMMTNKSDTPIVLDGNWKISGADIELVLNRWLTKKSRTQ